MHGILLCLVTVLDIRTCIDECIHAYICMYLYIIDNHTVFYIILKFRSILYSFKYFFENECTNISLLIVNKILT